MNEVAKNILQRTNALGISINRACREAGVSRSWFEDIKKRIPKSIDAYIKIERMLLEMENSKKSKI